jgi:hypothetical protein
MRPRTKVLLAILALLALAGAYLAYVELMTFMAEIAIDPNTIKL